MVKLHIKDHCIETAAKLEFKRLMDKYFDTDNDTGILEDKIDVLREFLETADFAHLRGTDQRLSGEIETVVYLKNDDNGIKVVF